MNSKSSCWLHALQCKVIVLLSILRPYLLLLVVGLLMLVLPALGLVLSGQTIPDGVIGLPRTVKVEQPGLSQWVFFGLLGSVLLLVIPFYRQGLRERSDILKKEGGAYPWWGWCGLVWSAAWWLIAWTRLPLFHVVQPYTFTPLWVGYIVVINALRYQRARECMLTHRWVYFLHLLVASAGFWWFFEYLNRYVNNWYYEGLPTASVLHYVVSATPPFATVLPAVLGTYEWLETFPRFFGGLHAWRRLRFVSALWFGVLLIVVGCATLFGLGLFPAQLYTLLWLSPLFVILGGQVVAGNCSLAASLERGDWRQVFLLCNAGLLCGFFWELWNLFSLAKWYYSVPYVQQWHVFEMPLPGYAGYLPFGIECGVVAMMFRRLGYRFE